MGEDSTHRFPKKGPGPIPFPWIQDIQEPKKIGIIRKIARPKDWSSKSFPIMSVIKILYTLVGRWYTYPSENMSSSVGMIVPNIWKNRIHVPNVPTSTPFLLSEIWNSHEGGEDVWSPKSFLWKLAHLVRSIYLPGIPNMMVFHGYVRNCQVWFTTPCRDFP